MSGDVQEHPPEPHCSRTEPVVPQNNAWLSRFKRCWVLFMGSAWFYPSLFGIVVWLFFSKKLSHTHTHTHTHSWSDMKFKGFLKTSTHFSRVCHQVELPSLIDTINPATSTWALIRCSLLKHSLLMFNIFCLIPERLNTFLSFVLKWKKRGVSQLFTDITSCLSIQWTWTWFCHHIVQHWFIKETHAVTSCESKCFYVVRRGNKGKHQRRIWW